jgi:hypothetical protein
MITENEIRERLDAVATQGLSLEDFGDWIEGASWNMHADSSQGAIDLASSVHLLFSEYDHGDYSESELRRRLQALIADTLQIFIRIELNHEASVRPMSRVSGFTSRPWVDVSAEVRV